jgi:hypothetical protein
MGLVQPGWAGASGSGPSVMSLKNLSRPWGSARRAMERLRAWRDLQWALFGARRQQRAWTRAETLVKGAPAYARAVFCATFMVELISWAFSLIGAPLALLADAILMGMPARWSRRCIAVIDDAASMVGAAADMSALALMRATRSSALFEHLSGLSFALGVALAKRPELAREGFFWKAMGLNAFALAKGDLIADALRGGARGGQGQTFMDECPCLGRMGDYCLWSSPEMIQSSFERIGILGAIWHKALPWSSSWGQLASMEDKLIGEASDPTSRAEAGYEPLGHWLARAGAERERMILGRATPCDRAGEELRAPSQRKKGRL